MKSTDEIVFELVNTKLSLAAETEVPTPDICSDNEVIVVADEMYMVRSCAVMVAPPLTESVVDTTVSVTQLKFDPEAATAAPSTVMEEAVMAEALAAYHVSLDEVHAVDDPVIRNVLVSMPVVRMFE